MFVIMMQPPSSLAAKWKTIEELEDTRIPSAAGQLVCRDGEKGRGRLHQLMISYVALQVYSLTFLASHSAH